MRVVDDHRLLVAGVHLAVEPQQVHRVELVERRRPGGVHHRDEPLGAVVTPGPGDDAARLVGVVPPGVRDDRVDEVLADDEHGSRLGGLVSLARPTPLAGQDVDQEPLQVGEERRTTW